MKQQGSAAEQNNPQRLTPSQLRSLPLAAVETVVRDSYSIVEVLRNAGVPNGASARRVVREIIATYSLDISHFTAPDTTRRYEREQLDAAVRASVSISEVIRRLGGQHTGGNHNAMSRRIKKHGIDTTHFTYGKASQEAAAIQPDAGVSEDEFRKAAAEADSVARALRLLGLPPQSRFYEQFRQTALRLEVDLSHFRGQAHRRGGSSARKIAALDYLVLRAPGSNKAKPYRLRMALQEIGVPYECRECGLAGLWNGKPLLLEVDHINGNSLDNRPHNLRLLCPNCHSQAETSTHSLALSGFDLRGG